jgi:putative transposase
MKRLRQLEEEKGKLNRIVADLSLNKAMLQDVIARKRRSLIADGGWWTRCGRPGGCRSGGPARRGERRPRPTNPIGPY